MKLALWFVVLLAWTAIAQGQTSGAGNGGGQEQSQMNTPPDSTFLKPAKSDSAGSTAIIDSCLAIVTVDSLDDGGVSVMLVMRKRAKVFPGSISLTTINPDTLGTWKPPLVHLVPTGFYDILLHKEGFKDIIKRGHALTNRRDSLSFSFTSLQHQREVFGTLKWISAGVALVAAGASLYLHQRTTTYEQQYNDAVDPAEISELRDKIDQSRSLYKVTSAMIIPAIAVSVIFWVVEITI